MVRKIVVSALSIIVLADIGVGLYDAYQGNSSLCLSSLSLFQSSSAWAQGQGHGQPGQGNAGTVPVRHEWSTIKGTVVSFDQQQGLVVNTIEQGQLALAVGPIGFAGQQEVTFNPGDSVTTQGFVGEQGTFVAGQITTDATLLLRDPNGRPLWTGRGQNQAAQ